MTPAMTPVGTGAKTAQVAAREPVLNSHADPEPPKDLPAARPLLGSSCPRRKQAYLSVSAAPPKANLPVYRFGVRSALALCDCVGIPEGNSEFPERNQCRRIMPILDHLSRAWNEASLEQVCNEQVWKLNEPMPPIDVTTQVPPPRLADDDRKRKGDGAPGTAVITKTRPQTKRPNLYRVLLLNDDYTPMEFVVHVLERFFNKDHETAHRIMMHVHQHGIGECGVFTYEVAETKVTQVMDFARKHQHPLQCIMEKK